MVMGTRNAPTFPHDVQKQLWDIRPGLANERSQIRSDPVPGLSVDTLGAFRVEIAAARSESGLDRSG